MSTLPVFGLACRVVNFSRIEDQLQMQDSSTEQDTVQTPILMEVFKRESVQSVDTARTVSTRKRAGPASSDTAMKRQRKEQTRAQDVSKCGKPVHWTRQKLKPSLSTFPAGLMQASYLKSPRMQTDVGEAAVWGLPNESRKEQEQVASMCANQRRRDHCKEYKGSSICEHQHQRY